jgi:hypothetical protein
MTPLRAPKTFLLRSLFDESYRKDKLMRAFAMLAALIVFSMSPAAIAQDRWTPLGGARFSLDEQRAVIPVDRDKRFLRAVRLQILQGTAEIVAVKAVYQNGSVEVIGGRQVLSSGADLTMRLQGREPLREFYINYIPRGSVRMALEGIVRGDFGGGSSGGSGGGEMSWSDLGCKTVGFLVDRDSINVSTPENFRALRLRAQGNDIEMIELRVLYDGGRRETLDTRFVIRADQRSRPIELRSDRRRIAKIEMLYRQRPGFYGKTRLCVDGLRLE